VEQAVADNPDWLFPRWSRGNYYLAATKNPAGQHTDLDRGAAQDPARFRDPAPWKAHFTATARQLRRRQWGAALHSASIAPRMPQLLNSPRIGLHGS
jgi:hypothetical protein